METFGQVLLVLGQLLMVAGLGLWCLPFALVAAGALLCVNGIAMTCSPEDEGGDGT